MALAVACGAVGIAAVMRAVRVVLPALADSVVVAYHALAIQARQSSTAVRACCNAVWSAVCARASGTWDVAGSSRGIRAVLVAVAVCRRTTYSVGAAARATCASARGYAVNAFASRARSLASRRI